MSIDKIHAGTEDRSTVFLVSRRPERRKVQHYCIVSVKLAVGCKEPLVAMTVTVDAVASVVA